MRQNNKFLTDSLIAQAIPIYNSLPSIIRLIRTSNASLRIKLKEYFRKEFLKDPKVTDIKDFLLTEICCRNDLCPIVQSDSFHYI